MVDGVASAQLVQQQAEAAAAPDDAPSSDPTPDAAPTGEPQFTAGDQALFDALAANDASRARQEIVFVSPSVRDYQKLLDGISPNVEVHILDPTRDGVTQMAEVLADRTGIDAVHLIGEGSEAQMHLGSSFLTQESISTTYAQQFQQIGQSLSANADLLVYGCNFGQGDAGQVAIETLAQLTGADVTASTDRTGSKAEFGDWQLEVATGSIEAAVVINASTQATWDHALATFTVTNTNNSGAGSLRQAILDANGNAGTDTIAFNIALNDPNHVYYRDNGVAGTFGTPVATTLADASIIDFDSDYAAGTARSWYRISLTGAYLDVTQAVIIDGSTQPGYNSAKGPIIEIDASGISSPAGDLNAIALTTGASTIRGLVINGAGDNAIEVDTGAGSSVIVGNYFGTDVSGTKADGNATVGTGGPWGAIAVKSNNVVIGGTTAADRNVISGNNGYGIEIYNSASGTTIRGNYIGTTVTGTGALGNASAGIYLRNSATGAIIGGANNGEANIIANNGGDGIWVTSGTNTSILRNTIHSNTELGIDLDTNGVTVNDLEDGDAGTNNLLNFPVITNVVQNGANLDVTFSVDLPTGWYRIEFYENIAGADPSGFGEGRTFLGAATINVTSNPAGYTSFTSTLANVTPSAIVGISATATQDTSGGAGTTFGSTSEFGPSFLGAGLLVVDTTSNTADAAGFGTATFTIASLLGNRGADGKISLREAIDAANRTTNIGGTPDQIRFNISNALVGGEHVITPTSTLSITAPVVIDGTTEPDWATSGNKPVVVVAGSSAGLGVDGFTLTGTADGSTIRGLVIRDWGGDGIEIQAGSDNNIIAGNYIGRLNAAGTDSGAGTENTGNGIYVQGANNSIGGTGANDRNVISGNSGYGVRISGAAATGNSLKANYIGVNATGAAALANSIAGVYIDSGASSNTIGSAGFGNVVSGNTSNGIWIDGAATNNNVIQSNYVGLNAAGNAAVSNGAFGVVVDSNASGTTIGTDLNGTNDAIEGNVISGNTGTTGSTAGGGVYLWATNTTIRGNIIGLDATGTTAITNGRAVTFSAGIYESGSSTNITIGGTAANAGNTIAGNTGDGIIVRNGPVSILGNSIWGNTQLGIDLGNDGVTVNDAGDGDSGANNLMNFPVIYSVVITGGNVIITGEARSGATVEFFESPDTAGSNGEGQTFIGRGTVSGSTAGTIDATARQFSFTFAAGSLVLGDRVSATATDASNNTSEFSTNVAVTNTAPVLDNTKSPVLTAQNEDSGAPSGAVGTLVSNLVDFASPAGQVDNVTDPDSGALLGIAITAADTTNGTWFYSINNGSSWNALGAVANNNARLLAADANTRLYFQPNANYNGTITNAITFHAWDQSSGTNGGTADLTTAQTVLDQFASASYSNNNGTQNWSASWIETDPAGGGAASGASAITGGELQFEAAGAGTHNMYREANLSGATSATLSFSYHSTLGAGDRIDVQASNNGGASYTTVATFDNTNQGPGTQNIDISSYISANTRIRIIEVTDGFGGFLFLDNLQISYNSGSATGGTTAFSTATDTASLTINAVNDQPAFSNLNGTPSYTENGSALVLDADVTVSDTELTAANNFNGATLTLTRNGGANSEDVFSATGTLSLSGGSIVLSGTTIGTYTNSSGTLALTFNGSATNARVNSAMQQITYTNSSDAPPASVQINWTFSDGNVGAQGSGGALTATGSVTVNITAVNDPPTITNLAGDNLAYTEGDGAVVIDQGGNATVTDVDSADFNSGTLTVSFTAGSDTAEDVLGIRNQGTGAGQIGVSASNVTYGGVTIGTFTGGSSGTNLVITLNVSATPTAVTALVKNITFQDTDTNTPTTGARTVRFVLTDGDGGTSANYDTTVTVSGVNDPPVNTVPGAQTTSQNTSRVFSAANSNQISISDVDAGSNPVQVTLTVTNGTLTLNGTAGLSFSAGDGTADATMTFTGTVANINTALNGLSFAPTTGYTGSATLQIQTNDQGNTGSGGALTDTDVINISVVSSVLWVSSQSNATVTASYGGISWTDGEIIKFGDPNLAFDPGTTSGTFSKTSFNLDTFAGSDEDVNALHYVKTNITVNGVALQPGDVLFTTDKSANLGGLAVNERDIVRFRPTTVGDYSAGTFVKVLSDPAGRDIWGIALVEKTTTVGDATLNAGDFLFTLQGATYERSVWRWQPATGLDSTELVRGNAINISQALSSIELVQDTTVIGDVTLTSGQILLSVDTDDSTVGTNSIAVKKYDIFVLDVVTTGTSSVANATLLFDGSEVSISAGGEEFDAIALVSSASAAPVLALPGSAVSYTENSAATVIDATATVTDSDSSDFGGGTLIVDFSANGSVDDRLAVRNQGTGAGQIGLSGSNVTYGGVTIGTWTGGTDGSTPLVISLNTSATPAAVQALARNITFQNVSDAPSTLARTVRFQVTDGDGGTSAAVTETINVTAVNDSPTVGGGSVPAIAEDTVNPPGQTISSMIGASFSDPDAGASLAGVLITNNPLNGAQGSWQYSTDGGSNWYDVGTIAYPNSLALSASTSVRFLPAANYNGSPDILSFRGLDNTYSGGFTNGATKVTFDAASPGGSSPISSSLVSFSTTITAVNDPPTITNLAGDSLAYN
ncbi:MAG: DUF4347 domain-containing protein, partial [Nitrospira sp.]